MRRLKIITLNVNSIIAIYRRTNLIKFLNTHNPDILVITETKLNKKHKLNINGYNIIRTDRPNTNTAGGGTAIIIKTNIKYSEINILNQINSYIETTTIQLNLSDNSKLIIVALYSAHGTNNEFINSWEQIFNKLNLINSNIYYILTGDINARHSNWRNNTNNARGIKLNNWLDDNKALFKLEYKTSTEKPTFILANSYLDMVFFDNRISISQEVRSVRYDSDHRGILFSLDLNLTTQDAFTPDTLNEQSIWLRGIKWEIYKIKIDQNYTKLLSEHRINRIAENSKILSNNEIDQHLNSIDRLIIQSMKDSSTKRKSHNLWDLYTNTTIERLYRKKSKIITAIKKIKRITLGNNNTHLISRLKSILNNVNDLIKQNIKLQVQKYWKTKIENITLKNNKNVFDSINQLYRPKDQLDIENLTIDTNNIGDSKLLDMSGIDPNTQRKTNNTLHITSTAEKLNLIGAYIQESSCINVSRPFTKLEQNINNTMEQWTNTANISHSTITTFNEQMTATDEKLKEISTIFVTPSEVKFLFKFTNTKKSSGLDRIPNIALKYLPLPIIEEYCTIFNNLINNNHIPENWKIAKIIPIAKKNKDKSRHNNYRAINLLPNISKIFEKIIYNELQDFVLANEIIPDNQFGFKKGHSTTHAIHKLVSDLTRNLNSGQVIGAILIDIERAFDSVWLNGLIFCLTQLNINKHLINIIIKLLYNREFKMTNGKITTEKSFKWENGLQQGTILAPILYNIYTSQLIKSKHINSQTCQSIAYADDMIIYSPGSNINIIKQKLQASFNRVNDILLKWKITINKNKCETILFRKPLNFANKDIRKNWKNLNIQLDDTIIEQKIMVKYLGIKIDHFLYFNKHIAIQLNVAKGAYGTLGKLFHGKYLNQNVKLLCYKSLIRPIITYGAPIWFNINASNMEKLRIFERKCIRACTSQYRQNQDRMKYISNKNLYNSVKLPRIDMFILNLIRKHIQRSTMNLDNSMIYAPYLTDDNEIIYAMEKGILPPESFVFMDKNQLLQLNDGTPIIYHINRRPNKKTISLEEINNPEMLRFDKNISTYDIRKFMCNIYKFWWKN